ncbi:hypothetical protein N5923_16815 [Erwiniaceae bacterium BAC15a-03b]|uniref:Uncharacterized protein n=1 Tax=Winslowiella arboricola TaxID=2978220 RepID=A0A9J6PP10_9GAMM|nr:hypothetical protein [Winslowiella arboricola]MCU5773260.1 hypothetical protein [Winslowiella arboricola]MCU5779146.1 hypothetical protein [Winslowiella arboricola]
MEMIMNTLLLLIGIARSALTRLSLQEWGYLLGLFFTLLRGLIIWRDNRTEQRKRTAILQQLAQRLDADALQKVNNSLPPADKEQPH